ncbi:MAG: response regulator [Candidatus Omnitrophica bacterium]|nr:response regulator [Candidatus Omnitrophota bacterium]
MVKILVLDDEIKIRDLVHEALSLEGYEVTTVPTSDQAVDIIFREPFDLILMDIMLAGKSGISILKEIREYNKKIPVIIYSGFVTTELETEARTFGANEVLRKDVGIAPLVGQIGKIVKAKNRIFHSTPKGTKRSILIVDDEEEIRNILKNFFKMKGCRTLEAQNGEEAVQLARSEDLSVVLLDMNMPGMDGLATLEKLKKMNDKLGVVMITGDQDDEKVKKAIELGAYGYVLKPFDFLYLELVVLSKLVIAESG